MAAGINNGGFAKQMKDALPPDFSEEKFAENLISQEKMKEAEEHTQIVLNATPLCCYIWDKNYKIISCNDETVRFFDLKSHQEYLDRFFDLSPTYQPNGRLSSELALENIAKAFEGGHYKFEWMHQKLNGELIPSEVTLARVVYKEEYMVAGYTRDLRETKAMMAEIHKTQEELRAARDEALANSKIKSEFLAKMSHEIRTPMNAIVGMPELMLHEFLSPAAKEYATTIKQAGENLLAIINDILDFSKIESGKLEIIKEKYQFSSVINDVINIISMRLIGKPIIFSVVVDSILPDNLIGDEVRVRQILLNLLSNAVKYTEKGSIVLEIYSEFTSRGKLNLIMDVTDTGVGIQEKDLENLFGDYTKFDVSRNKGIEGTGLGLAITKKLSNAMGGDIFVESAYGEGSTFRAVLPQDFYDYKEIASINSSELYNILLYEPRKMYAQPMISSFDNLGVKFTLVSGRSEFIEALKDDKYSFIFLPSFLFYRVRDIVLEASKEMQIVPKFVVITDYGEAINETDIITVSMPVYSVTIAEALNEPAPESQGKPNINIHFTAPNAKVLIVDDISTNLKVAKGLMSPYNMQIETCENGMEALELIKTNHYDIVFMDYMMPVMDGIETTKKIREIPSFKDLPIIAFTANVISGAKEMFFSSGFSDFLAKPVEMTKLIEIFEKWIPKDKKEDFSPKKAESQANITIKIDGVDVDAGLSITGGVFENYIEILEVFHKDGLKKIQEIEDSLKSNDIKLYATYVHALKSTLASIGAAGLSTSAKNLEFAGKSENIGYIENNNDAFIRELRKLLGKIGETINPEGDPPQSGSLEIDSIKPELLSLEKSLNEMDGASMNEIIKQLKARCKDSNLKDRMEKLEQYILMCEYEEAAEYINSLIN